jgi:hypothetical protein
MSTGSFIEMFMTTFGWHLYEIVWGVISSTGLAYLPFFAVIIDNVIKPLESQEAKEAAVISLRRLEIDIIRLIIMMMLAVSPYMTISYGAISFTKACQGDTGVAGQTVNAGNSGTKFDEIFRPNLLNNQEAKAPPWFYIVMSVSGGINDAVISRLPCEMSMRQAEYEMSTLNISDPHLKRDVQRFITECHQPAIADFYNNRRVFPDDLEMNDIDWPGSKYFNNNFYVNEFAKHPTPGFAFDESRQSDMAYKTSNEGSAVPENGYPSCQEWWGDSTAGLRTRLVDEFPRGRFNKFRTWFAPDSTVEQHEDTVIRKMLANEGPSVYKGLDVGSGDDYSYLKLAVAIANPFAAAAFFPEDAVESVEGSLAGLGVGVASLLSGPTIYAVKQFAPYIQATLLMMTYFLLPWVLLVGNYEWSTIRTATTTIFAIKFWTAIWAVTELLDNQLFKTILSASGSSGISYENRMMGSIAALITLALYIGAPAYFLSILGWGGESRANASSTMGNSMGTQGQQAGASGSGIAASTAKMAATKGKSK